MPVSCERYITGLLTPQPRKHFPKKISEEWTGFSGDKQPEALAEQMGTLDIEEAGTGKIHGTYGPVAAESKVADRSEIEEVGVLVQSLLHLISVLEKLGVLQLQFD